MSPAVSMRLTHYEDLTDPQTHSSACTVMKSCCVKKMTSKSNRLHLHLHIGGLKLGLVSDLSHTSLTNETSVYCLPHILEVWEWRYLYVDQCVVGFEKVFFFPAYFPCS
jgi:hypothetical protein